MCEFCESVKSAKENIEEGARIAHLADTELTSLRVVRVRGSFFLDAIGEDRTDRYPIFFCPRCGKKLTAE